MLIATVQAQMQTLMQMEFRSDVWPTGSGRNGGNLHMSEPVAGFKYPGRSPFKP
jgi:hypothetical protein